MNKGLTLITLLSSVNAAAPFIRNDQTGLWFQKFPYYQGNVVGLFSNDAAASSLLSYDASISGFEELGGYRCIRSGQIYSFP